MGRSVIAGTLGLIVGVAAVASAQSAPPIGVRAAGMGGAFTALADDGTAPFCKPAALAAGSFASVTRDGNALDRQSAVFAGLATPPLGLSYYRTTSTAPPADDRNAPVVTSSVHHAGVTLVQSLGDRG